MKIFFIILIFPVVLLAQSDLEKAEKLIQSKHYASAELLVKSYVEMHPNDIRAIELLGDAYGYQQKWDKAIETYQKLVNSHSQIANYHYKYGGALGMKALSISKIKAVGIIGDAKEEFLKASQLDHKHIDARWALVELYMQLPGIIGGSKSKALKYAGELESLSRVDGFLAKGYIYAYDHQNDRAENYFKQAVIEGGSLVCYEKLANFYIDTNAPVKAIITLETAYSKLHNNGLHYQIGKVAADFNVELDKGEKALKSYLDDYKPEDKFSKAEAHYRLAQILRYKKAGAKALHHIQSALKEAPKNPDFLKEEAMIRKL